MIELITNYFTDLTYEQKNQFGQLQALYEDWNSKINVISRKDIDQLMLHHVLHSLAIAKLLRFRPETSIVDVGTGGGFPGIPLAIMFPEVRFTLIDSIGKKIKVVEAVANALGLDNVTAMQMRSEELKEKFDFVVSRAVTTLPEFVKMTRHLVSNKPKNSLGNGIIYLKGGDVSGEIKPYKSNALVEDISNYFKEEYFVGKKVIHLDL